MKKTSLLIKSVSLCVCIMLFLCGCKSDAETSSKLSSNVVLPLTKEEPQTEVYIDLLSSVNSSGNLLTAYGELCRQEYTDAIKELETALSEYNHNISFAAYTLDNRKAIAYNTDSEIFCACTVKAAYSYYCCLQLDKGLASLDTTMVYEQKHYESGTGDMQYSPFGTLFDMSTIITKSMSISDNVAYFMQVDYFGTEEYNNWISSLGCKSLQIKPTVWSLRANSLDHIKIWREIYNYFQSDAPHSEFLYNICTNTQNNFATSALEDVDYSHKCGHSRDSKWPSYSDAGIVWKENNPYIIAIITDAPGPSYNESQLFEKISKIVNNKLF